MRQWTDLDDIRDALAEATGAEVYEYRTPKGKVTTPYIVIAEVNDNNFRADDYAYVRGMYVSINLLTFSGQDTKNAQKSTAEKSVEDFFKNNGMPFRKDTAWLSDLNLFHTEYTVKVIYGESD